MFGAFAFRSRVTGVYFSIITQALTFALMLAFFRNDMGFGGNNGMTDFKDIFGANIQSDATRNAFFVATVIAVGVAYAICMAIIRSKLGKVLIAVRDAESRTRFLGYRVERYKLFVWVVSACLSGVAGALYVPQVGIINPSEFAPEASIEAVIWVAVGGRGTLVGPILGAVLVNGFKSWFTGFIPELWLFALGALFVLTTLLLPKGILGTFLRPVSRAGRIAAARHDAGRGHARSPAAARRRARPAGEGGRLMTTETPALLYLNNVTVSFDGFKALNALSLAIDRGEMRAIIGPNGAGKTTMMDVITGKTRADEGEAVFAGVHDLTVLDEARIADLGIGRKFQRPTVFESHTVYDNLQLALKAPRGVFATLFAYTSVAQKDEIEELLDTVHLADEKPHARRQSVARPEAVARDRHAAGAGSAIAAGRRAGRGHDGFGNREDRAAAARDQSHANRRRRRARHGFRARALDVKVTVLHEGSVLAEGPLDHVSADERVIEVYLGR